MSLKLLMATPKFEVRQVHYKNWAKKKSKTDTGFWFQLNEKKEVLAHQKLAAQILGDRVKVLEAKLAQHERDGVDSGV